MATYLLVHGAWGGGAAWNGVAKRLPLVGHEVHIATLTGLGAMKHHAAPGITLSTHIADVAGLIDEFDLNNIILVGHSYGGMVISGVADAREKQIAAIVYVDAFLPRDGEALWDIADEPSRKHYIDGQRNVPGLTAPFPGAPPSLSRHPLLTLTEPVRYRSGDLPVKRRTYIYATKGAPTVFTKFHDRVTADSGWRVHSLATGHGMMQDDPDGLTTLLLAEAR